ncbi:MAG: DUF2461 family protein, partial [Vicinamibacterales bacterium]
AHKEQYERDVRDPSLRFITDFAPHLQRFAPSFAAIPKATPRGYDPEHPFIDDLKRKDFLSVVMLSDRRVCAPGFMGEFAASCSRMNPLVDFLTEALGLKESEV